MNFPDVGVIRLLCVLDQETTLVEILYKPIRSVCKTYNKMEHTMKKGKTN